jgi:hypothetical protein
LIQDCAEKEVTFMEISWGDLHIESVHIGSNIRGKIILYFKTKKVTDFVWK